LTSVTKSTLFHTSVPKPNLVGLLIDAEDSLVLDDTFFSGITSMEMILMPMNYEVDPNHIFSTGDTLALNTDVFVAIADTMPPSSPM